MTLAEKLQRIKTWLLEPKTCQPRHRSPCRAQNPAIRRCGAPC
ncbi:hypothetical protein HFC70_13080 [Agrobacterium sp. a22-2]|nr:hypothetical protein [Agrobacterium sp. a22-2]